MRIEPLSRDQQPNLTAVVDVLQQSSNETHARTRTLATWTQDAGLSDHAPGAEDINALRVDPTLLVDTGNNLPGRCPNYRPEDERGVRASAKRIIVWEKKVVSTCSCRIVATR